MTAHLILLNWDGWEDAIECLESVFRLGALTFRFVVCNHGSADGSIDQHLGGLFAVWARIRDRPVRRSVKVPSCRHGVISGHAVLARRNMIEWVMGEYPGAAPMRRRCLLTLAQSVLIDLIEGCDWLQNGAFTENTNVRLPPGRCLVNLGELNLILNNCLRSCSVTLSQCNANCVIRIASDDYSLRPSPPRSSRASLWGIAILDSVAGKLGGRRAVDVIAD